MTNELQAKFTQYDKEYALSQAKDFIEYTNRDLKDITRRFFIIGFRLNEAKEQGYVEALGYPDIETLAEEEFGFKRSTTYGLIAVFRRFAEISDNGTYLNYIQDRYKDYSYSQLLEINKLVYLPSYDYIKTLIPPNSSVRDVAAFIKFRKEKASNEDYTLPQWKALQTQETPVTEEKPTAYIEQAREQAKKAGIPFYEGDMDEDFNPYVYDGNMSVEDYKLMHKLMEEDKKEKTPSTVQTSGLRTSAKQKTQREEYANENWQPIQDTDTIISQEEFRKIVTKACKTFETKLYHPCDNGLNLKVAPDLHADNIFLYLKELLQCKNLLIARNKMKFLAPEEKPMRETRADKTYNFSTRDGVREFLQDYKQWDYLHYDPFLRATYRYGFKNGMYLFACETQVFCGKDKPQDEAEMQVTYFLNAQNMKSCAQISKRQLEQFCALHKDEL